MRKGIKSRPRRGGGEKVLLIKRELSEERKVCFVRECDGLNEIVPIQTLGRIFFLNLAGIHAK
jgi:hypothetical protein